MGSPALAGMDPCNQALPPQPSRLPRARGDGPMDGHPDGDVTQAPPRSRGWTPDVEEFVGAAFGSLALAGMDLLVELGSGLPWRLPRARGDGPYQERVAVLLEEAPPRSRGWTPRLRAGGRPALGSPALAGMDLLSSSVRISTRRLPRARGDGPALLRYLTGAREAPPRSRGWTHASSLPIWKALGSPALAGMDPGAIRRDCPHRRLPRARGDGPLSTFSSSAA